MSKTVRISDHSFAAHLDDGRVYILSNAIDGSLSGSFGSLVLRNDYKNWEVMPQSIGGYKIVPYGWDNNIPVFIRNTIGENNLAPGIIERQRGLLWGQGPQLYRLEIVDGTIIQSWVRDAEVERWLSGWDYKSYLLGVMGDYLSTGGYFDAKHLARGARVGASRFIAKLEHLPVKNARLEWPDNDELDISCCRHILTGDFEHACSRSGIREYPVFLDADPGRFPVAASYVRLPSFGHDFYALPQFWGAMRWIVRGSEIPSIFKYVTDNGINLAYHVHSSQAYWDYRREVLQKSHPDWDDTKIEEEIMNITKQLLDSMVSVLTGKENAGKMFHSIDCIDDQGNAHAWKIEAVDQKIKDFVESQLKIAEASVSAITSGMGLHPSLSNIMVNGKLASGSEMLYAFKLYLASDTAIPSNVILSGINKAIRFNFPGKDVQMGFYHQSVKTEESLSASSRIKNQ